MEYHFAHAALTADGRSCVRYIPAEPVRWAVRTLLQSQPDAPRDLVFDTPEMAELFAGFINRRVLWSAWMAPRNLNPCPAWMMAAHDAISAVLDLWRWFTEPVVLRTIVIALGVTAVSAFLGWLIAVVSYLIPSM